jgi:hypothetical protein
VTGFAALLELARGGFSAPGFAVFSDLLIGWVLAPGRRTITGMIAVADPGRRRAHDAYHRLVRDGAWSMSVLWRVLAVHAIGWFAPAGVIPLDCDDTLFHKSGRNVDGAGIFRDAVRSTVRRVVYALGLNLVVATLRVQPRWAGPPIAIPVNARLHRKNDDTTTIEHAEAMLRELADWLPQRHFHLAADGAYATLARRRAAPHPADQPDPPRRRPLRQGTATHRPTRPAPHQGCPPAHPRRPGRPHRPAALADRHRRRARHRRRTTRARAGRALVQREQARPAPRGHRPRPHRRPARRLLHHHRLTATGADVASRYAGRWSIEVCFRDVKQHLGAEDPQSWKRQGPERAAYLGLWLHALIWCWYLHAHPTGRTWIPRPWYTRKASPSFLDALAALRRLWSQRITAMSAQPEHSDEITTALLDTLAYAA